MFLQFCLLLLASLAFTAPFGPDENRQFEEMEESGVPRQSMNELVDAVREDNDEIEDDDDANDEDDAMDENDEANDDDDDEEDEADGFDDELLRRRRRQIIPLEFLKKAMKSEKKHPAIPPMVLMGFVEAPVPVPVGQVIPPPPPPYYPPPPPPYYPPPSYPPPVIPPYVPPYAPPYYPPYVPPHAAPSASKAAALNAASLPSHSAGSEVPDAATLAALSGGDSKQLGSIWQGPSNSAAEDVASH